MSLVVAGCSGDKGGGPVTPKAQAPTEQYEFYLGNTYWPPLEIYKGTIGDKDLRKVELPGNESTALKTLALSADGSVILLITDLWNQPDRFLALNATTLDTLCEYENIGKSIEVSPGGKYIAVYYPGGSPTSGVNIFDGSTLEFLYNTGMDAGSLRFTRDDYRFYYTQGSGYGIYDLDEKRIESLNNYVNSYGRTGIRIVQPTPEEEYLFMKTDVGYWDWQLIEMYDPVTDSILTATILGRDIYGDMCLSPDGRLLIVTDPKGGIFESDGTELTSIIDARTGAILAVLNPPGKDPDCGETGRGMVPTTIDFSPDSHYTIFGSYGGGGYAVLDNSSFSWKYFDITGCRGISCNLIACRQK